MKIFQGFEELTKIPNPVLTIGTFDGVHLGHQKIIKQLNTKAQEVGGESVLFTFYPHPRMVLFPQNHGLKLIQTQVEKLEKLERVGLQNVIVHPFTKRFSRLSAVEFVRDFLVNQLNVKTVVIGYDHQFGKNREGSLELLQELAPIYGFDVIEIGPQDIDDVNVSSTKIRRAIETGDIETANTFLGEPFEINGTVVQGKEIGRSLGYPTANLDVYSEVKLLPQIGVYAVRVVLDNKSEYFGLLNVGLRPTVDESTDVTVEVHILDFSGDIYGQNLTLKVLKRVRDEQKYETREELKTQIGKDVEMARHWIDHFNW
ncbi:MAG: bifunctional riboflavin kinase/FAD synthetase [Brumimicrobium sp.]|nr:bifunctional riboflavin kinase/FAD synthetase [Brumimicrobium sp.]